MSTVQYRLVVAKKDERIEGPDDASVVFAAPIAVVDDRFDAVVEFMRGRLKATGDTGEILDLLKGGAVDEAFRELASRP
jgi:hypothetical protein